MRRSPYSRFEQGTGVSTVVDVFMGGRMAYRCQVHLSRTTDGKVELTLANHTELRAVAIRHKEEDGEDCYRLLIAGVTNYFPLDFDALGVDDYTPLHEIRRAVEAVFTFYVG